MNTDGPGRVFGNLDFATVLGELVMAWNELEQNMKAFVGFVLRDPAGFILAAEMGVSAYTSALKALANDVLAPDVGARLLQCVAAADILRAYRNYYVHGTIGVIGTRWETDPPQQWSDGLVQYLAAKQSFTQIRDQVHPSLVRDMTEEVQALRAALSNTLAVALWDKAPTGERPLLHQWPLKRRDS